MITTFDGKQWNKEELIQKMYDDSFYYGYLGKNALSSSSCKTINKSPKTYKFVTEYGSLETPALRDGRLFHTMLLEPNKVDDMVFVDVTTRTTKKFKEALQDNSDREVYTVKEKHNAERLVDQLRRNEQATQLLSDCMYEIPEAAMIDGIPFRGKADVLRFDSIVDVKTTTDINNFKYSADKYGYDLQAYLYMKMFDRDEFKFLVIDKGSCDIGIYDCSPEFIERGKIKLELALEKYKRFFKFADVDLDQYVLTQTL